MQFMELEETKQIKEIDLIDWVGANCEDTVSSELEEKICAIYPFLDDVENEIKNSVYHSRQNPEVAGDLLPQPIFVFVGAEFKNIVYRAENMVLFIDYDINVGGGEPDEYFNLEDEIDFRNAEFDYSHFLQVCGKHAFERVVYKYVIYVKKLEELERYFIARFVDIVKPTL